MGICKLCGKEGYHYCPRLDMHTEAYEVNSAYRRVTERHSVEGKVGGTVAGALMGGLIGAVAGFFLGDILDD